MPSFDIASKLDGQLLDNAINVAKKDILNRWDFRDSKSTIELNKKDLVINISTENDMRLEAILDAIHSKAGRPLLPSFCLLSHAITVTVCFQDCGVFYEGFNRHAKQIFYCLRR